jgi:hypothetical protein
MYMYEISGTFLTILRYPEIDKIGKISHNIIMIIINTKYQIFVSFSVICTLFKLEMQKSACAVKVSQNFNILITFFSSLTL